MAQFIPKTDPKDIHVYDDNGKLITNPDTLHSIIEGQLFIAKEGAFTQWTHQSISYFTRIGRHPEISPKPLTH